MEIKNTRKNPEVLSFLTIRRSIGILGMILPFTLLLLAYVLGCRQMQPSLSHYFYTPAGGLFVGILCAVGLFLICYKGFSREDDMSTNLAGIFAFGIAFFPTGEFVGSLCRIVNYPQSDTRSIIHYGCAALFFSTLAYISFFLFTKSKGTKTDEKVTRNRVYRVCAVLMMVCVILVPVISFTSLDHTLAPYNPTFWLETGALISFGISWLVKGKVILDDEPKADSKLAVSKETAEVV